MMDDSNEQGFPFELDSSDLKELERIQYAYQLHEEFSFAHDFCFRLHDQIVSEISSEKFSTESQFTFDIPKEQYTKKEGEDLIEWLANNGYQKEVNQTLSYELLRGLLTDFAHFVYTAIENAKKVKVSIALALLRKPFLEILLIIEQLVKDEDEFMSRFGKSSTHFDPTRLTSEEKQELIKAITKNKSLAVKGQFFSPDFIYEIRFDKNSANSLYSMSNLANHIVTNRHASFTTEKQNLNLVFLNDDDFRANLNYFYFTLPLLLFYALEVIDSVLNRKRIISDEDYKSRKLIRVIGFYLYTELSSHIKTDEHESVLDIIDGSLSVVCENCQKDNVLYKSDYLTYFKDEELTCKHCLNTVTISDEKLDIIYAILHV